MKPSLRESRSTVAGVLLLFAVLGVLSVFILIGESRRARILVEYEADRIASSLSDAFRIDGTLDQTDLDPRVRGFALYTPEGNAAVRFGNAPGTLDISRARAGFSYDMGQRLLVLQRLLGPGGPGMMGFGSRLGVPPGMMNRGMMGEGMMGGIGRPGAPHAPGGAIFLSMDISAFRRSQTIYRTAAATAPFAIAALAALFITLLSSNVRHRRRAQEQETLARLGESARTLAHEIRNPLGAIRIQTGLLRRKTAEDARPQLDAIEEEVERLALLSRRVSDFLKNPRGEPQSIELDGFMHELASRQQQPISYLASETARHATVSFDSDMLRSVMENLLRNAFESGTTEGVELALTRERGSVVIAVRDRGKGIPPELMEKVFDPFYTDKAHGSGVGLSLARRFVEAAGGTLRLLPRDGGGTEARVTLPAGVAT